MSTAASQQESKITQWEIDPVHSAAHFSVRHLMISNVRGEFGKVSGSVTLDQSDLTRSKVTARVDTSTIDTREPQRDAHLRSPEFFDAARFPALTFQSKQITAVGPEHFKVTGALTIRDVTRDVSFDVEGPTPAIKDAYGNTRAGISASAKINRKEFGLVWNALTETGGVVVGDEVSITFEAELIQKA